MKINNVFNLLLLTIHYLSIGITDKDRGHGFDNGTAENITECEVQNHDIVGGTREVGEIAEDDEEEDVDQRSENCEEELRANQK